MKQVIPFVKDISLNSNIYEITSISLEHNLKMENNDSIVGNFKINGNYKENKISFNEKNFEENILFDITLDDKYDSNVVKIDIDNFYYEIVEEEFLRVHIDVLIDNLVYKKEERCIEDEKEEVIDIEEKKEDIIDIKSIEEELKLEKEEENKEIIEKHETKEKEEIVFEKTYDNEQNNIDELANNINLLNEEEVYVTYKVHIIRENETIDTIIEKYNTTKEELEKYNVLDNIMYGSKIIVPINNEQ